MKLQTSELAKTTGISVRTLHYYDEIGLLKPSQTTKAGYRFYDEVALEKLQQILFFKELDFSLKDIQDIISRPSYDKAYVLNRQKELLILKKERLEKIITAVEKRLEGDSICMQKDFKAFDMSQIEKVKKEYHEEVKQHYGNTKEYLQSEEKTKRYTKDDWKGISEEGADIFKRFALLVGTAPDSEEAQGLVSEWKNYITNNFYDCTIEIFLCLGEMYINDERFKKNIDSYKAGTAQFMCDAIKVFAKMKYK